MAAELEARWNAALRVVVEAEAKLEDHQVSAQPLNDAQRRRLLQLGTDLETAWNDPQASVSLKKRILRTVVEEIVADIDEPKQELMFRIHWVGGVHTTVRVHKNRTGHHQRTTDRAVVEVVRELAHVCPDASIAAILNRLGYATGAGNSWTESRVRHLRSHHEIPVFEKHGPRSWMTLAEAAAELKVHPGYVRKLIQGGLLPAKQVVRHAPWLIKPEDLQRREVRECLSSSSHKGRNPRHDNRQNTMAFL